MRIGKIQLTLTPMEDYEYRAMRRTRVRYDVPYMVNHYNSTETATPHHHVLLEILRASVVSAYSSMVLHWRQSIILTPQTRSRLISVSDAKVGVH